MKDCKKEKGFLDFIFSKLILIAALSMLIAIFGCGGDGGGDDDDDDDFTINVGEWSGTTDSGDDVSFVFLDGEIADWRIMHNICGIDRIITSDSLPINPSPDYTFYYFGSYTLNNSLVYTYSYNGQFTSRNKISGEWTFNDNGCGGNDSGTWSANHMASSASISIQPSSFDFDEELSLYAVIERQNPTGLTYDGTHLWHTTNFTSGYLYKMDTSGNIIESHYTGDAHWGLTFDGTDLWVSEDDDIQQYDTSGNLLKTINAPGDYANGLAFDGTSLWNVDNGNDEIHKIDTDGVIISTIDSPGVHPVGLTFDGTHLWNSDADDEMIYRLDTSGNIVASYSSPGSYPSGLAFDGTYLWNADYEGDEIYKLRVPSNVDVGEEAKQRFTILNEGYATLSVNNISIQGSDPSDFSIIDDNCSNLSLGFQESCTFALRFSPLSAGEKDAEIRVESNDSTNSVLTVTINGNT